MLESLTEGFTSIIRKVRGQSRLTEANINETSELIRDILIDADVALPVVKDFVERLRREALGKKVLSSLTPDQAFIGLVKDEITELMGPEAARIARPGNEPVVVLLAGLQGAGKTTTTAKLARLLKQEKKRVLAASADIHRPAAIEQLMLLCEQIGIDFHEPKEADSAASAIERATAAVAHAKQTLCDYVLIDSAGRNVIDEHMMDEIEQVSRNIYPSETLLVIDSTQGQEAISVAKKFDEILAVTGVCLTKLDGDARGGAAMSVKAILGVPIKYVGVGERPEDLESFIPDRMASRILGMGDILSLVESATTAMGKKRVATLEKKLRKKRTPGLQLGDMIEQMRQAEKMGGLDKIAGQLPSQIASKVKQANIDSGVFKRMEAIFLSMTKFERLNPSHIKGSRKQRIASGAGVEVNQVNQLLSQHSQANKFMKKAAKNPAAAMNLMRGMFGR